MPIRSNILTVLDVADRLGLHPVRVRQFCQQGRLGVKIGRDWIITEQDLRRFAAIPRHSGRQPKSELAIPDFAFTARPKNPIN